MAHDAEAASRRAIEEWTNSLTSEDETSEDEDQEAQDEEERERHERERAIELLREAWHKHPDKGSWDGYIVLGSDLERGAKYLIETLLEYAWVSCGEPPPPGTDYRIRREYPKIGEGDFGCVYWICEGVVAKVYKDSMGDSEDIHHELFHLQSVFPCISPEVHAAIEYNETCILFMEEITPMR